MMMLSALVLVSLGFVMFVSEPLKDWKVLWGFSLFNVGIFMVVMDMFS